MLTGFKSRSLTDYDLTNVGILDANHRRAILNKIQPGVDEDFNNMLGDLSSVIKDLECFSVVCVCCWEALVVWCGLILHLDREN